MHRRSRAVRLTLLPVLASASLAKAQTYQGDPPCTSDDPNCPLPVDDGTYQDPDPDQDPNQVQVQYPDPDADPSYVNVWTCSTYTPVYVSTPVQRHGFGTYFAAGTGG